MPSIDLNGHVEITVHEIDEEQLAVIWSHALIERIALVSSHRQPFVSIVVAMPKVSITYFWSPEDSVRSLSASLVEALVRQGEGDAGQIEGRLRKYEEASTI